MSSQPDAQAQGFTVIQVLVAAFVLTVAVIGMVIGFNRGLTLVGNMRQMSAADRIAQETMEEIRGGERELNDEVFDSGSYTVSIDAEGVTTALTRVTVTVDWDSRIEGGVSRSLVTYFTEGGIGR